MFTAYVYQTKLAGPWWDFQIFTLDLLTTHSSFVMKLMGIGVTVTDARYMILENAVGNIRIDQPCLAIDLMFMFAFLIISYPSTYKLKAIFGIGGIIGIHFLNVLRVSGVALVLVKYPDLVWPLVDKHHLIFDTSVYILIFLMFVLFTRLSNKQLKRMENAEV